MTTKDTDTQTLDAAMQQPRAMAQAYENGYKAGAAAEREAIAQSLDKQADLACDEIDRQWAQEMAAAVRARSNT